MFNIRTLVYDTKLIVDSPSPPEDSPVARDIKGKECREKTLDSSPPEVVLFHGGCAV